jgi:FixJ family two-component response regulator
MSGEPFVHVVDDDASYRAAVDRMLRASGFNVRLFSSGTEFLAQLAADARGCVIADLEMPGLDGLALQQKLAAEGCPLPVVFLTGRGDVASSVRAIRQGAVHFIEKRAPKENLIAAIAKALELDVAVRCVRDRKDVVRRRFAELTDRELEVLRHVLRGRINSEIASDLGIHERTVKLHRAAITRKVGVRSVPELMVLSDQAGLLVPD